MAKPFQVLTCFKSFLPEVPGGIATAINDFADILRPDFNISVLTCRMDGPSDEIIVNDIHVTRCNSVTNLFSTPISPAFVTTFPKLATTADLIALHSPFPLGDLAVLLNRRHIPPVVVHWHADLVSYPSLRRLAEPLVSHTLKKASAIVVSDEALVTESALLSRFAHKCAVVPFGVDTEFWSTVSPADQDRIDAIRARYPRMVVACGRLVAYKGFDVLIDAANGLDAQVVIIGVGPLEQSLRVQAAALPDARVNFLGVVSNEELRNYLHAGGVFAFPSVSSAETFGISQLEAMSCGCAVVNTGLRTSVPKVARHGQEALTVTPGAIDELRNALHTLLNNSALRNKMSIAAKTRARQFSRASAANALADVYRQSLDKTIR